MISHPASQNALETTIVHYITFHCIVEISDEHARPGTAADPHMTKTVPVRATGWAGA